MAQLAQTYSSERVSLADVPKRDRVRVWREFANRSMIQRAEDRPLRGMPLVYEAESMTLPGLRMLSGVMGPGSTERRRDHLEPDCDDYALTIVEGSARRSISGGRELIIESGEALLRAPTDCYSASNPEPAHFLFLQVPRSALSALAGPLENVLNRPIRGNPPPLRLLRRYLGEILEENLCATPELGHAIVTHVHDLIVLTLGAARDGEEVARARGWAAARLQAIKSDIVQHLARLEVSAEAIAGRHAMSPRHVQRLFQSEGSTLSAFVLDQRLARAHKALANPRRSHESIAAVAYDCGFGDLSHFNRSFRRRFGVAPSDVRAEAREAWAPTSGYNRMTAAPPISTV